MTDLIFQWFMIGITSIVIRYGKIGDWLHKILVTRPVEKYINWRESKLGVSDDR